MPVRWSDLEEAFYASGMETGAMAWIHATTGEVRITSPNIDGDEPPSEDDTGWHEVPDARELDLKQRLVEDFVSSECPDLEDEVRRCFSRRGAWRAYKDLLAERGRLERWYRFENRARRRALLAWAADEGIEVVEVPTDADEAATGG
jgi:hypothetical protein